MSKGYVYLIRQGETDLYKIGHTTKKPESRLRELQTGNPNELKLITYYKTKFFKEVENLMHIKNNSFHVVREWFRFDLSIESSFINECQNKESNAKFLHETRSKRKDIDKQFNDRVF